MSPYDILGLQKDATPEQIKAVYRRASSAAHPDKGGSDAAQAAVNEAYAILGDPERRQHYDQTGETRLPSPIEQEAQTVFMQILAQALEQDSVDTLAFARTAAIQVEQNLRNQRAAAAAKQEKLAAKRAKVRSKGDGVNLVHSLIDQQIEKCAAIVADAAKKLEVAALLHEMLAGYEEDQQNQHGWHLRSGTGSTTSETWGSI